MAVKIRLSRTGKRNAPAYRIVAADSRAPRDGRHIEIIGYYNPSEGENTFDYDKEKYKYWLSVGAQPTEAVKKLVSGKYEYEPYKPQSDEGQEQTEAEPTKENTAEKGEQKEIGKEISEGTAEE